jgi:ParB family chromosome partitioning protein
MSSLAAGRRLRCDHPAGCSQPGTVEHEAWVFCTDHSKSKLAVQAPRPTPRTMPQPVSDAAVRELPTRVLTAHPGNVRGDLGDLEDMTASVRAQGILQPLLVTRGDRGVYVVIAGHRRLAAALQAGLPRVPVVLRERLVGTDAVEAMLVENLQRADLDPVDEAKAYRRLLDAGRTRAQVAKAVGKTEAHISVRLALLNLHPGELEALRRKEITLQEAYEAGRARSPHALAPGQRRPKPRRVPHFVITHPQAEAAASSCEHETTLKLGVACGPCWETAIRDDERRRSAKAGTA